MSKNLGVRPNEELNAPGEHGQIECVLQKLREGNLLRNLLQELVSVESLKTFFQAVGLKHEYFVSDGRNLYTASDPESEIDFSDFYGSFPHPELELLIYLLPDGKNPGYYLLETNLLEQF